MDKALNRQAAIFWSFFTAIVVLVLVLCVCLDAPADPVAGDLSGLGHSPTFRASCEDAAGMETCRRCSCKMSPGV